MADRLCPEPECGEPFPDSQDRCPHCGRPAFFPNVYHAGHPEEQAALDNRYHLACNDLNNRGCDTVRQDFEAEIQGRAVPVISMSFNELEWLAAADTNLFSTYYHRVHAGTLIPRGTMWDVFRNVVESANFPGYKEHIRFGVLSLDGEGVRNYGECHITLKLPWSPIGPRCLLTTTSFAW